MGRGREARCKRDGQGFLLLGQWQRLGSMRDVNEKLPRFSQIMPKPYQVPELDGLPDTGGRAGDLGRGPVLHLDESRGQKLLKQLHQVGLAVAGIHIIFTQ